MQWAWLLDPSKFWTLLKTHLKEWIIDVFTLLRAMGDVLTQEVLGQCQGLFPAVDWGSVQTRLDQINVFFPLSECVAFATALFGLWATVFIYRVVKSWIPTVAGA